MSTAKFSFRAKVRVGDETIPLLSEVVAGDKSADEGVERGFLFRLDRQEGDPPLLLNLGKMIEFIEQKLGAGAGSLSKNPKVELLSKAFPEFIGDGKSFDSGNTTQIQVKSFELNSTTKEFLFSFSVDVTSTDPTQGLIALPPEIAEWVRIDNLAISFSATKKS